MGTRTKEASQPGGEIKAEPFEVPITHTSMNHQVFLNGELGAHAREQLLEVINQVYRVSVDKPAQETENDPTSWLFGYGPQEQLVVSRNGLPDEHVEALVESSLWVMGIDAELYEDPSLVRMPETLPYTPPAPEDDWSDYQP